MSAEFFRDVLGPYTQNLGPIDGDRQFGSRLYRRYRQWHIEFGVDRVKYDAAVSYAQEAAKLKIALGRPGVMDQEWDLAFGSPDGELAAAIATIEFVTHGWDLARATNSSVDLDPELAEIALANAQMLTTQFGRQPGVFADELPAPEGADAYQRLAAFVGRDPVAVL